MNLCARHMTIFSTAHCRTSAFHVKIIKDDQYVFDPGGPVRLYIANCGADRICFQKGFSDDCVNDVGKLCPLPRT